MKISQFKMSTNKQGASFDVQSFLTKLPGTPWSKYPGEKHLPGYQYCGPGTRLDIRLDENDRPLSGEEPINRVDQTCYRHDLDYRNAEEDLSEKHEADRIMLQQLNLITNPALRERLDRLLIKGIINSKLKLGVGVGLANRVQLANELHKPYRKLGKLLKVKVFNKDDTWSADLVDMPKENLGRLGKYRYILTVIDLYTRYAWSIPLKQKTATETKAAFESIFKTSNRIPKKLWTDEGKEFYNKQMKTFLKQHNIILYSASNEGKAVVVERLNRTLKGMLWKQFTIQGNQKWLKILPNIVDAYNNKIHRMIKTTPKEASENPDKIKDIMTKNNFENEDTLIKKEPKFKIDDKVRIYKYQYKFTKGFVSKWTNEIFTILEVIPTTPTTYRIQDEYGEVIEGSFYENKLQCTVS